MISTFKRYECRTTMLVDFPERQVNTFHVFAFFGRLIHVVAILIFLLAIIEQFCRHHRHFSFALVRLSAAHLVSYLPVGMNAGYVVVLQPALLVCTSHTQNKALGEV